jgi:glycosyltransferase involved in cell wall biosynthesis
LKIVILYAGTSVLGGIETLLFRVTSFLVKNQHEVTVFVGDDSFVSDFREEDLGEHIVRIENYHDSLLVQSRMKNVLEDRGIVELDGVIALDSFSALGAPLIARLFDSSGCTAVASNWMPDYYEFMREKKWHPLAILMRWNLLSNFNGDSVLMMTRNYIEEGKKVLGQSWAGTVFPIPIRGERFLSVDRMPVQGKIVSVGRLSPMKDYNLHMPQVIAGLRRQGFDVSWHVYGDGALRPMMESLVQDLGLSEHVVFEGVVNYSELPSVFGTAKYFVGMGTAALEASLAGVPGVYALAFKDDGSSCGTICESDIGNFDELAEMPSDRNIQDELVRLLQMDEAEYGAESERVRACAMKSEESVVMPKLLVAFGSNPVHGRTFFLYRLGLATYVFAKQALNALLSRRGN